MSSSSSSSSCESKEVTIKPIPIVKPKPKPAPIPTPILPLPSSRYSTRLFCVYAKDLQQNSRLHLADAYRPNGDQRCPFCRTHVSIQPGKAWELVVDGYKKKDECSHGKMAPQTFRIKNRFIVKCHRERGGFACVLCARFKESDTVCRGIEALMDHLWREHSSEELERDADIVEV
jgi:hypothetical protein